MPVHDNVSGSEKIVFGKWLLVAPTPWVRRDNQQGIDVAGVMPAMIVGGETKMVV